MITNEKKIPDNESTIVSYVNQWRFRSSHNKTASLEFFFNDGSLSGDDLMYQLFHVLSMCNNINIRVLGLCLDGGGNNSRLLSLLRHEAKLGNSHWFDDETLISFKDPTSDKKIKQIIELQ